MQTLCTSCRRQSSNRRSIFATLASVAGAALLSGCAVSNGFLLASGWQVSTDLGTDAGNTRASFLGAEGEQLVTLPLSSGFTNYEIIAIIAVESGELQLEVYDGSGVPGITLQGRPSQQITRSAMLNTNERGELRYRIQARSARNGGFQILYRRQQ
jgi:hypothetical protein